MILVNIILNDYTAFNIIDFFFHLAKSDPDHSLCYKIYQIWS